MTIKDIKDRKLLLFECISGSRAYGLANERSDTDIKGVYFMDKDQFFGLDYIPQISNDTNDETYYELARFVELLLKNNPNILELAATPADCVLFKHPIMERLHPDLFLSKLCRDSFAGYAATQMGKARGYKKKFLNPVAPERKSILDFCFVVDGADSIPLIDWLDAGGFVSERCGLTKISHTLGLYSLYYDQDGSQGYNGITNAAEPSQLALTTIRQDEAPRALLFFNKDAWSKHCKDYKAYWDWVDRRNEDRFRVNMDHGKGYDSKNMMHMIRLLLMGNEILEQGRIHVRRPDREMLLAIKAGEYDYDQLLIMADQLMARADIAYQHTGLMEAPDRNRINSILIEIRKELYR